MRSEREKMAAGEWYTCLDDELAGLRDVARVAVHEHNTMPPGERGNMGPKLAGLVAAGTAYVEAPFHCAYGINIKLGDDVHLNAGCSILDCAAVSIGEGAALGPNVQIYCAEHHHDPVRRCVEGLEIAYPVSIGRRVWIEGGAIILAGAKIGEGAVIGAGSVVTRDVGAGEIVVGNPARVVRRVR